MTDHRIACINPRCRRTASFEKMQCDEIICGKCWKLVPLELRTRYREVRKRYTKIERIIRKRERKMDVLPIQRSAMIDHRLQWQVDVNWAKIRNVFAETSAPEGLENFMMEAGII